MFVETIDDSILYDIQFTDQKVNIRDYIGCHIEHTI